MTGPDRCRYCGGRVLWHGPGGQVFGDASVGHLSCYEDAETRRQAARREEAAKAGRACPRKLATADGHDEPGLLEDELAAGDGACATT
jgi:hypothetical protein